jgi:hypothetical protein
MAAGGALRAAMVEAGFRVGERVYVVDARRGRRSRMPLTTSRVFYFRSLQTAYVYCAIITSHSSSSSSSSFSFRWLRRHRRAVHDCDER